MAGNEPEKRLGSRALGASESIDMRHPLLPLAIPPLFSQMARERRHETTTKLQLHLQSLCGGQYVDANVLE